MSQTQEKGGTMPIHTGTSDSPTEVQDTNLKLQESDSASSEELEIEALENEDPEDEELESDKLFDEDLEMEELESVDIENEGIEAMDPFLAVPPPPASNLDTEEKVRLIVAAADAVRAEDIEVLDLRTLTIIADYFMICTGKSSIQLRAIADRIDERLREEGIRKPRMEGYQEATWILLDYGDVVCHLMAAEQRDFYRLEEFWDVAPRLELELLPEEARNVRTVPTRFETLTEAEDAETDGVR